MSDEQLANEKPPGTEAWGMWLLLLAVVVAGSFRGVYEVGRMKGAGEARSEIERDGAASLDSRLRRFTTGPVVERWNLFLLGQRAGAQSTLKDYRREITAAAAALREKGATVDNRVSEFQFSIHLTGSAIQNDDLKPLKAIREIDELTIECPNVTDAGLEPLRGTLIRKLRLQGVRLTEKSNELLSQVRVLELWLSREAHSRGIRVRPGERFAVDLARWLRGAAVPQEGERHRDRVRAVALSPDQSRLASGGDDHRVMLWDVATGEPIWMAAGHRAEVTSVVFDSDGQQVISASRDGVVKVFDATFGWELKSTQFAEASGGLDVAALSNDGRLVAHCRPHRATAVCVWRVDDGSLVGSFSQQHGVSTPGSFALSPDGKTLAIECGAQLMVADVETSQVRSVWDKRHFRAVAFSPDGKQVAASLSNHAGEVLIFDLKTLTQQTTVPTTTRTVRGLAFASTDARFVVGLENGRIEVIDSRQKKWWGLRPYGVGVPKP